MRPGRYARQISTTMRVDILTIERFGHDLRRHQTSAVRATEACLRQIEARDSRLNAFIRVCAEDALRQAIGADRELTSGLDRGPLHGVPISIKDLLDVYGVPTTAASHVREGHTADRDASVITNLRNAGAVLIGKTNLHEFAFGTTNEDSAFGLVRNPHDETRSPGGSSGGSAVSVVAGMALASVGTDTGGSIRIPAAACGLVGLKPSIGEVSTVGVVPLSRTMDHVGPLAHTTADAWHLLNGLVGRIAAVPPRRSLPGLRFGVLRPYFCDVLDDDVRTAFEVSLDSLRTGGAHLDEIAIRSAAQIATIYLHLVFAEAAAYHAATLEAVPDKYTPPVRERLELARYVLAEDYVRARIGRDTLTRQVDEALIGRDGLLLPTLPIPAPLLGADLVRVGGDEQPVRNLTLRLTQLFNITGHPAISLPSGRTSAGLPCGLQVVAPRGATDRLIGMAMACETALAN